MIGYHFTGTTLRDGSPIPAVGVWLEHNGPIGPCQCGLHASEHPFDALQYAPGVRLHRVELQGDLVSHGDPIDKWAGRRRRIIASIDADAMLREFARWCASQVLHLWNAPQVVKDYLATGDEALQDAARGAALGAAWDAARGAALGAARGAALGAAWDASRGAALAAARDAAWGAALAAQRACFAERVELAFTTQEK